ncbi:hypothetical protein ALO99_200002 [Pseudomonas coronafaciens pv. porri]|nr:hypothetical protein ALO99_200002 [Pseudomonas coronafaciens pv. porri]
MLGCKLSIDDFGMGASNIERLLQLPFSELKNTHRVRARHGRRCAQICGGGRGHAHGAAPVHVGGG